MQKNLKKIPLLSLVRLKIIHLICSKGNLNNVVFLFLNNFSIIITDIKTKQEFIRRNDNFIFTKKCIENLTSTALCVTLEFIAKVDFG